MSNKQLLQIGVIVLIVLVVASFSTNINRFFRRIFGNSTIPAPDPTPLPEGEFSPDFDALYYVSRLRQVLSETLLDASPRCDAYRELIQLNDAEFVHVTNEYLEIIGRSLRADMENTWQSGCSIFSVQWDNRVIRRMDELKIRG